MRELNIIYMGTPDFAVPPLKKLVEEGYKISAVITAPDKPKGRGQKLAISAVKEYALSANLPILQPTNLKDPLFIETLKGYQAKLQIVVAFRMLPEVVWNMPEYGTFNLHGSLLPQYRGAAPIHWAVINGEKTTGLTTFFLKHEIDTGNILLQEKEAIRREDTTGSLYKRLMEKGAELVLKTVKAIEKDDFKLIEQDTSVLLRHAPKLFKENTEIDWSHTAEDIFNFVRGLNPFPSAWSVLNDKKYKLHFVDVVDQESTGKAGDISTDNKTYIYIQCGKGKVAINEFQQEGKKRMFVKDFLRGNQL
ncbi:MAG: methionyl-tRNA formyltransferase [Marivirga sp.]|jgi:methionyl-tRNA formyltransferase